jgi:hypothetical protein
LPHGRPRIYTCFKTDEWTLPDTLPYRNGGRLRKSIVSNALFFNQIGYYFICPLSSILRNSTGLACQYTAFHEGCFLSRLRPHRRSELATCSVEFKNGIHNRS